MFKSLAIMSAIVCSVLMFGCSQTERVSEPTTLNEASLKEDEDFLELISIRDEMISRALKSNVSGAEMAEIVEQNDEKYFASILGYTEEEIVNLGRRIVCLGEKIMNKYPELQDMAGERVTPCTECAFKDIAEKWDNLLVTNKESIILGDGENGVPLPDPSGKGVTCQWLSYTATLAGCTVLGPVLYFACAAVAMCQFCTGGWVTTVCQ